jgi:hypothetical protein
MNSLYIVVENGEPYNAIYQTFESAANAVKAMHKEEIERQIEECGSEADICSEIDVPENTVTGITHLYVEKGINIYIHKLPISSS